ncbi:hypothetical protein, partial [Actinoallomurus acaciae]
DAVLASLEEWAQTADGQNPAATAVDDAAREATAALGGRVADAQSRLRAEREAERSLLDEIERLESGGHDVPPVPYTRSGSRADRPGAPLWNVTDFADAVLASLEEWAQTADGQNPAATAVDLGAAGRHPHRRGRHVRTGRRDRPGTVVCAGAASRHRPRRPGGRGTR